MDWREPPETGFNESARYNDSTQQLDQNDIYDASHYPDHSASHPGHSPEGVINVLALHAARLIDQNDQYYNNSDPYLNSLLPHTQPSLIAARPEQQNLAGGFTETILDNIRNRQIMLQKQQIEIALRRQQIASLHGLQLPQSPLRQEFTELNQLPSVMSQLPFWLHASQNTESTQSVYPFSNNISVDYQGQLGNTNGSTDSSTAHLTHSLYQNSMATSPSSNEEEKSNAHRDAALNLLQLQQFKRGGTASNTDPQQPAKMEQSAALQEDNNMVAPSTAFLKKSNHSILQDVQMFKGEGCAPDDTDNSGQKQSGKPKRPLSAYNIFFKEERERLLKDHITSDNATLSRKRKKSSGMVGFEQLGKIIGERWKNLDEITKSRLQLIADQDKQRYNIELARWKEIKSKALTEQQALLETSVDKRTREEYFCKSDTKMSSSKIMMKGGPKK